MARNFFDPKFFLGTNFFFTNFFWPPIFLQKFFLPYFFLQIFFYPQKKLPLSHNLEKWIPPTPAPAPAPPSKFSQPSKNHRKRPKLTKCFFLTVDGGHDGSTQKKFQKNLIFFSQIFVLPKICFWPKKNFNQFFLLALMFWPTKKNYNFFCSFPLFLGDFWKNSISNAVFSILKERFDLKLQNCLI